MTAAQKDIHQELVNASRLGSRDAQYQLYQLYNKAMFNSALRITNHWEEAEDVVQEAFVKAFKSLDAFRGDSSFGSWLKRIVINQALTKVKSRRLVFEKIDHHGLDLTEDDGLQDSEQSLSVVRIKDAITRLPDGYRMVLSLYLMEGYDHAEIAQIMGITESTSKSQFKRAKDKLRSLLEV